MQKMKVLAQFYDPLTPLPVFLRSSRSLPPPLLSEAQRDTLRKIPCKFQLNPSGRMANAADEQLPFFMLSYLK